MDLIFKKLDDEEFQKRVKTTFNTVYFTYVSIIQGVALGVLIFNSKNVFYPCIQWQYVIYPLLSLGILIVASYSYTLFIGTFGWPPTFLDTLLPLLLGVSETLPMFFFKETQIWWLLTGINCFVGSIAFLNSYINCSLEMFEEGFESAYETVRNNLSKCICFTFLGGCVSFCRFFIWERPDKNCLWPFDEVFFILFIAGLLIILIVHDEKFLHDLYERFKFERLSIRERLKLNDGIMQVIKEVINRSITKK